MSGAPLFSVLMPTHSRVDVIGHAIRAVLDQSLGDFELLIVGDGAAEGTSAVVEGFADPRIRWFDLPKAPHFGYANRNVALRESRGRYIAFAADDDLLFPDHLAILAGLLEDGAVFAAARALWVSSDGVAAPFLTNLALADEMLDFMEVRNTIAASCIAYCADALPRRDVWPEEVETAGDWRLWRRILRDNAQAPARFSPEPTVLHFSAAWRKSRFADMPEFRDMLTIADAAGWWPQALKREVPEGGREQAVWAAAMRADPEAFTHETRSAAADVAARLAWDHIRSALPENARLRDALAAAKTGLVNTAARQAETEAMLAEARVGLAEAREALAAAEAGRDALRAETEAAFRNSTSWKLTAPLRLLSATLRGTSGA